jgi:hypothetical protein
MTARARMITIATRAIFLIMDVSFEAENYRQE